MKKQGILRVILYTVNFFTFSFALNITGQLMYVLSFELYLIFKSETKTMRKVLTFYFNQ